MNLYFIRPILHLRYIKNDFVWSRHACLPFDFVTVEILLTKMIYLLLILMSVAIAQIYAIHQRDYVQVRKKK